MKFGPIALFCANIFLLLAGLDMDNKLMIACSSVAILLYFIDLYLNFKKP